MLLRMRSAGQHDILTTHGEERGTPRVSNHAAKIAADHLTGRAFHAGPRLHHGLRHRRRRAVLRRHHESARRRQGRPPRRLARLWRAGAAGLSGPGLSHHPQGSEAGRRLRPPLVLQGDAGRPRSTPSGTPASPPAAPTTARRACATITRPITPRSCAIPTATASRRSATTRCENDGSRDKLTRRANHF